MKALKDTVKRIAKEEGYKSITEFINAWIKGGETFYSLRDWLALEKGVDKHVVTIWLLFRDHLTIPYGYEDQFWYKWDAVAKAKGFKDASHMVYIFRKRKLCLDEMAEEINLSRGSTAKTIKRLSQERAEGKIVPKRQYIRHQYRQSRDRNGISHKSRREVWRQKLAKYGFRSLRDAVWRFRKRGMTYVEMAKLLEITDRDFRYRRRRAGL